MIYESSRTVTHTLRKAGADVIYRYGEQESDPRSGHILLDAERMLVASTTTGEVRTVAVEDALVETGSETPEPDGYDVLAAKHYGRTIGEEPTIRLQD